VVRAGEALTKLLDAQLFYGCLYEASKLLFCLMDIFMAALFIDMCRFEQFISEGIHLVKFCRFQCCEALLKVIHLLLLLKGYFGGFFNCLVMLSHIF